VSTLSHRIENRSFVARIKATLRAVTRDRRGATTVEYLVLVAIIALGGIAAMGKIKDSIDKTATGVGSGITGMTDYNKSGGAAPAAH
jgi:Flp pilus assembly pilin Flp